MKEQIKLVQEMHKEKSPSMNKVLEQWFINKNHSFGSYFRAQEGLLKLLGKAFDERKEKFQSIIDKLGELASSNSPLQKKSSLKRLLSTITQKEEKTQAHQFLQRMTNSFMRETHDYQKQFQKSINGLKTLQKDRVEVLEKQNIYFRNILIESMKKRCSLKEIYVLSNFVLREAQKIVKLIREYKELVKRNSGKEQQILDSFLDNLKNCNQQFPEYSEELAGMIKDTEKMLQEREIELVDVSIIDPFEKVEKQVTAEELSTFLSTSEQEMIWTSNVEGLQTSFLNQMSTRSWKEIAIQKQDLKSKSNSFKVVITTDGYLLIVDKYKLVEYELKLSKVEFKQEEATVVNVSKNGLLKLMGLENVCSLKFQTEEQSEEFLLHIKKFK